jgi:transposase
MIKGRHIRDPTPTPDCPWPREPSCHSTPDRPVRSPKRPSASPTPLSPRAPSDSASPTNSDRSTATTSSPSCSPPRGQPAASPARLALTSVLQYLEGLSDRQAADAVRGRLDGKYALGLELTDPGFDHTVLSEFRSRLVHGQAERQLLDTLLDRCRELGLIRERGRQRTDSTHVLAAVRVLNRLERVGETMRAVLNDWAVMAPDWLQALAPPEWYRRYGRRVENYHLPQTDAAREELARVIAADGERLLAAVEAATDQPWLAPLPVVLTLRRVGVEQSTGDPGQ